MKKGQLKALFIEAKGTGQKYIGVMIQTEGSSEPEVIINPKENFNAITATEYIEQLRINGLSCGEIIINTIPRGATVIIDGETGFATMDGENKFKDVSLMEFPYLTTGQEKEHHLIYGYYTDVSGVKWLYVAYKNVVGFASSKYLKKK